MRTPAARALGYWAAAGLTELETDVIDTSLNYVQAGTKIYIHTYIHTYR